ncbi:hypothetical protein K469DRAFT_689222 [Zopfia rhizophila CBS 207.26]|uniref:Uncharacterized protein n=1 Tax=Zopfia rhizophila CBS 207.26 TaxID=1314779 RepID=A0A6A6ETR9_9PEZI|nr:hypothetical protein K469DRAFT_689222 [Zopfia rhizophila CBS 207.26]
MPRWRSCQSLCLTLTAHRSPAQPKPFLDEKRRSKVRHNLSTRKYWLGNVMFAFFQHEADLEDMADGSMLQHLATAMSKLASPQPSSAIRKPVRSGVTGQDALTNV